MPRKAHFLLLFFTLLAGILAAQPQNSIVTEVYGKVIDAATKEPLPYVNIRLKGTGSGFGNGGAMTDPKGAYYIRTIIGRPDSISFSFTGFRTRTVPIQHGKVQELNIKLGSEDLVIATIVIKPKKHKREIDTIARYVFYKVLEHKSENRTGNLNTCHYQSYQKLQFALLNTPNKFINLWLFRPFKFVFDNKDTTESGNVFIPGLLKETISDVYYRKEPKTTREFIRADKFGGVDNNSLGSFVAYHFADVDAYDNLLILTGVSFTGPFAGNALATYDYFCTDTAKIDGRVSYKLVFVGRVKEDVALKGFAWIDSATWAIRSINFRPNEKANMNFVNDYTINQDFILLSNNHWMKNREELTTVASLFKKKSKMSIMVTKTHDLRNIQPDIEIPDSIFRGKEESIMLDSARQRSYSYWDTSRFEPLTPQERNIYHNMDTFKTIRAYRIYQSVGHFFTAAYIDAGPISIGRMLNVVSKNNVEGWRVRIGFETNPRFKGPGNPINEFYHKFYFNIYGAYGLADKKFKYQAMTRVALPRTNDRWQMLELLYRSDMRVPGQDERQTILTFDNVLTLLSGRTLSKIMRVREGRVTYEKEWFKGLSTMTSVNEKTFYSIPGVFDFTRKNGEVHLPNFDVTELTMDFRYTKVDLYYADPFFRFFLLTKYPVFMFRYTLGMANMHGDYYTYHNFHVTIKQRLSSIIGHTNYLLRVGKIFGGVPYTAAYMTQGNLGILRDQFNYNLLREFEFVTDQYASFWVEHHFDGYFFNKIPGFRKLRLREVIFAKSLIGTFNDKNLSVLDKPADLHSPYPLPYIEAGFGIENIFYLMRIDFLWRLTYRDPMHQDGVVGPNWGIKIAINPAF